MVQQDLFHKIYGVAMDSADAASTLQQQTEKYPFFALNHYFQLRHTAENDPEYAKKLLLTGLYLTDHFQLQRMLETNEIALLDEPAIESNSTNEPATDPIKDSLQSALDTFNSPAEPNATNEPLFEPLHTTDYFASQGIKLSEQVAYDDKLGIQMRSFTEWLKTIKKVPAAKINTASEKLDQAVEKMAETSNQEEEVLTEAMAEVFLQQGKREKAIEIYRKLSLLYPSKSLYFADKIENLK